MKKLSHEQKKIIYIALIIIAFLLLFWIFVYAPQSRKFISINRQLSGAEAEIAQITRVAEGKELSEAIRDLQSRLKKIEINLPSKDGDVINNLSGLARKLKISIKNLDPQDSILLENKVPGYNIEELPVSMQLAGEFKAIGEYLDTLRNDFPVLIQVKQLNIRGKGEGQADLDINLKLSAYLNTTK